MPPKAPLPKLADDLLVQYRSENPKRAGTKAFERYEQYKAATTVAEAVRLGAARGDIANDVKQGFCTILDETGTAAPREAAAESSEGPPAKKQKRAAVAPAAAPLVEVPAAAPVAEAAPAEAAPAEAPQEPRAVALPLAEIPVQSNISASSKPASAALKEVDLSFAKLDGKPLKFIKRTMGEAKRLLCEAGLAEAEKSGYEFLLKDRDNLSKWSVQLRDLNPDGKLAAALKKQNLEPCVDLELSLPDGFPLEPPFARVVYPELKGGYVFPRGAICFEALTQKGWVPSMTLPALAIAIKGILDYGEVTLAGVGNKETRTVPQYTEDGARKDHSQISSAHRGGEGNTYGSLNNYRS